MKRRDGSVVSRRYRVVHRTSYTYGAAMTDGYTAQNTILPQLDAIDGLSASVSSTGLSPSMVDRSRSFDYAAGW